MVFFFFCRVSKPWILQKDLRKGVEQRAPSIYIYIYIAAWWVSFLPLSWTDDSWRFGVLGAIELPLVDPDEFRESWIAGVLQLWWKSVKPAACNANLWKFCSGSFYTCYYTRSSERLMPQPCPNLESTNQQIHACQDVQRLPSGNFNIAIENHHFSWENPV